jgi:hypothetical protein
MVANKKGQVAEWSPVFWILPPDTAFGGTESAHPCLCQSECWVLLWLLNTHVPPSRREYPLHHVKQGRVVEVYAYWCVFTHGQNPRKTRFKCGGMDCCALEIHYKFSPSPLLKREEDLSSMLGFEQSLETYEK